jgi:hypothetical protein
VDVKCGHTFFTQGVSVPSLKASLSSAARSGIGLIFLRRLSRTESGSSILSEIVPFSISFMRMSINKKTGLWIVFTQHLPIYALKNTAQYVILSLKAL